MDHGMGGSNDSRNATVNQARRAYGRCISVGVKYGGWVGAKVNGIVHGRAFLGANEHPGLDELTTNSADFHGGQEGIRLEPRWCAIGTGHLASR